MSRKPDGPPIGLDPVTPTRFGEIIDADRVDDNFRVEARPETRPRRDQISRATWVMIVIAGVLLGVAMAMLAAG